MQRMFCSALAQLIILAVALFCRSIVAADDPAAAAKAADLARGAALRAADTNALARILADDFKYTHSNGYQETKAIHIKSFLDGLRYTRFDTTNVVAHVITPDVVVLNGIIDQKKGVGGKMTDYHLLFHSVWRKKGDQWQIASLQTAAPPPPAKK
jgi:ketosteroid isomerase-like protein